MTGPRSRRSASRGPWARLALVCAALILFILGYYAGNRYQRPDLSQVTDAILLRPPLQLPEFHSHDYRGEPLGLTQLRGRWSLLLVGATRQAATRQGLALMTRIHNRLAAFPERRQYIQPVLLSADPLSDTPLRLRDIVYAYNPELVAAAGTDEELAPLLQRLALSATDPPQLAALQLIDPRGRLIAVFTAHQDPATIARDIRVITDAIPAVEE